MSSIEYILLCLHHDCLSYNCHGKCNYLLSNILRFYYNYFYYNNKTDYFETSLGNFDAFSFITMNIQGSRTGPLLNNMALFQLYQEIFKEHMSMCNSSSVSKFPLRRVGGRLFSVGSTHFWHPWPQSPGQNSSSSLQNKTFLALKVGWEGSHG